MESEDRRQRRPYRLHGRGSHVIRQAPRLLHHLMQLIDLLERHAAICHLLQKLGITDLLRSRTVYGLD